MRWGPKGKVEALSTNETQEGEVEIGGVIGIVRLWDGELRYWSSAHTSGVLACVPATYKAGHMPFPQ